MVDGLTSNSIDLILKLKKKKKGIICSLLVVINSFKLQKYHLVNYLFQGTKGNLKGLKVLNHLPKVVSLPITSTQVASMSLALDSDLKKYFYSHYKIHP